MDAPIDSDLAMVVAKVLAMLSTFVGFSGFVLKVGDSYKKSKLKKAAALLKKAEPANDQGIVEMALVTDERPDSVAPYMRPTERSQETMPSVREQRGNLDRRQKNRRGTSTLTDDQGPSHPQVVACIEEKRLDRLFIFLHVL